MVFPAPSRPFLGETECSCSGFGFSCVHRCEECHTYSMGPPWLGKSPAAAPSMLLHHHCKARTAVLCELENHSGDACACPSAPAAPPPASPSPCLPAQPSSEQECGAMQRIPGQPFSGGAGVLAYPLLAPFASCLLCIASSTLTLKTNAI